MDYCYGGPNNFSVAISPNDIDSGTNTGTITYGTFNLWCGTQNPIPT
jgi:hypothetical protein